MYVIHIDSWLSFDVTLVDSVTVALYVELNYSTERYCTLNGQCTTLHAVLNSVRCNGLIMLSIFLLCFLNNDGPVCIILCGLFTPSSIGSLIIPVYMMMAMA